jgi:drug/metabolite transporter (DMT)-like permease
MLPVIAALAVLPGPADPGNRWRGIGWALVGGVASCLGNIPFFDALTSAKASAVVPVTALYPLVTVLLAVLMLRERLGRAQAAGIALSLVAIYLLNVPEERGLLSGWLLVALVPVVLWGIAGFLQKVSTTDVSGERSAVWFLAAFVPVGAAIPLWEPLPTELPWRLWAMAALWGFALALGNYAATVAYARGGKASVITPLVGLYPLASIAAAVLFFGERIGPREGVGIALALVSIAALSREPASRLSSEAAGEGFQP